ncbi:MAG: hypothetical protein HZB61_09590 [Nitrospirae bacterium]|nr:hypothetical protein [Nitrospirota bacterium]
MNGEGDIRDIKGPLSFPGWEYLYILLAILAIIIIAVLLFKFFRKKKRKVKETVIPLKPAHETAYEALKELMNKNYLKSGRVREFYFELSNIVRYYVEDRFHLRAPEMTTEEFLITLKDSKTLTTGQQGLLKDFLSRCDMVKFAKYLPGEKEAEASYDSAKRFVDETKEILKSTTEGTEIKRS